MRTSPIVLCSIATLISCEMHLPANAADPTAQAPAPLSEAEATLLERGAQPVGVATPETITQVWGSEPKPYWTESETSASDKKHLTSKPQQPSLELGTSRSKQQQPSLELGTSSLELGISRSKGQQPSSELETPSLELETPSLKLQQPSLKLESSPSELGTATLAAKPSSFRLKTQSSALAESIVQPRSQERYAQLPANSDPTTSPIDQLPSETDLQPPDPEDTQTEVGEIRIIERPTGTPAARRQPDVQLLLRSSVFSSSNITSLSAFSPSDTVLINSAALLATPKLGETTRLIASAGGGLVRFATQGDSNYNTLNFNVAIQQRIAAGTYGQLGWVQENLYRSQSGKRLLQDNSIQFILGRQDSLGQQLRLDSFYELRASFTNPDDQNRVVNTIGTRLRYDLTPKLQGALDYRLSFKNFTQVDRSDTEHQVSALAIYTINPDFFLAGSVSYLFGRSSESAIDLNNFSIGLTLGLNVPLF